MSNKNVQGSNTSILMIGFRYWTFGLDKRSAKQQKKRSG